MTRMQDVELTASDRTPLLHFAFAEGRFLIEGESYPEDVRSFYDSPMKAFEQWLAAGDQAIEFDFRLVYFNSASAKVFFNLLERLEAVAEAGRPCTVRWYYASDDDNIRELGEEFGADLGAARFELIAEEDA